MEKENQTAEKSKGVSSTSRIRENEHRSLTKDYAIIVQLFQGSQKRYQHNFKEQIRHQFRVVKPDATEAEIEAAVATGGGDVFADQILSPQRLDAQNAFQEIQEKHRDVLMIEDSLVELQSIFVDLAALVDMQGEVLNNIEKNVSKSVSYVEKGVTEVHKAGEYQKKARRKMCIIIIMVLAIMLAILIPVFLVTNK